jgi:hypothetical protein
MPDLPTPVGFHESCLCLIKLQTIKTDEGLEIQLHAFLTSAHEEDESPNLSPGSFTPRERISLPTGKDDVWIGTGASLNAVEKTRIF